MGRNGGPSRRRLDARAHATRVAGRTTRHRRWGAVALTVALAAAGWGPATAAGGAAPGALPWEQPSTPGVPIEEAPGQGFNVNAADLAFILDQIKIAEAHAATATASNPCGTLIGPGPDQIPAAPNAELQPLGLRTVDGTCNNLVPGQEGFGAADRPFPRLTTPVFQSAQPLTFDPDGPGPQSVGDPTSYAQTSGWVEDSDPRTISNLIVDQTATNPAAVAAAGPGAELEPGGTTLIIPNVAPDEGASPPFNTVFPLFGQFFDHGLDLTTKSGDPVYMPLQPDDPLWDPAPGAPNFMILTRAINDSGDPDNQTTPFVDQQQTYGSTPSQHIFLREYELDAASKPVSTGRMLTTPGIGGLATWAALKAQSGGLLGIQLVDADALDIPLLASDPYGRFERGPNGYPQIVLSDGTLREGDPTANGGAGVLVPANAVRTGHAFLIDIAHHAVPGTWDDDGNPATPEVAQVPDTDPGTGDDGLPGTYDDEMLDAHFMAGDGRANENIGLIAVHHVFHAEHNRLVDDIKNVLATEDPASLPEWQLSPGVWNGERLLQAARFITEMEYQHLAFEEFARRVQPAINEFDAYDATIDAAISVEFSQAVYRFGHSMLREQILRFNEPPGVNPNHIDLFDAFLNPPEFLDGGPAGTLTPEEAAGSIFRGAVTQVGAGIDEFVTEALRNGLVGLPLDLAALNIARARDYGIPPLNEVRRQLFTATGNPALQPYANWNEFALALRTQESLVNFVAAYGTHPTITAATTLVAKRAAADTLIMGTTGDAVDFMNGTGPWADAGGVTTTGVDAIDLWVGGLAERNQVFGGMLGDTMNYVFELQLERLQDGDRFYYLLRTGGMNLLVQLEGNSFSELIERNTTAVNLPADVFARPDYFFDAAVQGSLPATPIVDDLDTVDYDERDLLTRDTDGTLRFSGAEHTNWAGDDSSVPGEGDRIHSGDGDDTVRGNGGDDILEGGGGNDLVVGGLGNDLITDVFGDDDLKGGDGNDAISAGPGLDLVQAGLGDDFVTGSTDPKVFLASSGNDLVLGADSTDDAHGDSGDDWLEGGAQGDGLEGDSGLPILIGADVNTPGHDVLKGDGGDDRYFGEGGDDLLLAGTGFERFLGQFGFDWVTHYDDPQPANSDLLFNAFAPAGPVLVDRFDGVEGLSGDVLADELRGDDRVAIDFVDHELDAAGIARISGLDTIIAPSSAPFAAGNIILGGPGSDLIEGRGGDDVIDGDARLLAQLQAPDPAGPPGAMQVVDSLVALRADILAGLIDPGDVSILRTVESGSGAGDTDTAVFSGPLADYDITTGPGTVIVDHARGDGASGDPTVDNGTDTLRNVEMLQFADQIVPAQVPPIVVPLFGSVAEGDSGTTVLSVPVVLTNPSTAPVTVDWTTFDYQATSPDDFVAATGTTTFAPGVVAQTVDVTVNGDTVDEPDEWLLIAFSNPSGATVGGFFGLGFGRILDDDAPTNEQLTFSLASGTTVPGVGSVGSEDILSYDAATGVFDMVFHGSDVGVGVDVDAFTFLDADSILLSFDTDGVTLPGVAGTIDDSDIVRFDATSLGAPTAGTFSAFFDGSAVGLTQTNEDIDAVDLRTDGSLLVSTSGNVSVAGVTATDEDVLRFTPTTPGDFSSGTWSLYFDGSDVGLDTTFGEDVRAIVEWGSDLHMSTAGDFGVAGLVGEDEDVFSCTTLSSGATTSCAGFSLVFDGDAAGLPGSADIDGMDRMLVP